MVDNVQAKEVKNVLLYYSGGYYAQKALELTACLIRKCEFDLSVLTIATKKTRAIQVQQVVKQYFSKEDIKAHYLLTIGDVGEEIKKVIKIEDIDMLITGASLHKHFEDFISFSLTDAILHETNIPVLFVR
ncbi:MAG: universal stress protein [Candidatus Omnitrophota bacterium]